MIPDNDWLMHPQTQDLRAAVKEKVEAIKEAWADGSYTRETQAGTIQANAQAIGAVNALEGVLGYLASLKEHTTHPEEGNISEY